jgi:hypothetical protein
MDLPDPEIAKDDEAAEGVHHLQHWAHDWLS